MTARAIMFLGTGSDVGRSLLGAGLCRIAKRRGIKVAPFCQKEPDKALQIFNDFQARTPPTDTRWRVEAILNADIQGGSAANGPDLLHWLAPLAGSTGWATSPLLLCGAPKAD